MEGNHHLESLNHHQIIVLLLQISIMLLFGKLLSELAKKIKQPAVVGEILAGIIIGPTILGTIFPEFTQTIFPSTGTSAFVLHGFVAISVVLLLFIAGLEVELPVVINQGAKSVITSFSGITIGFSLCFATSYLFPDFFGVSEDQQLIFSLFLGIGMSVSALAVVARTLLELGVFKSNLGMLIVASSMVDDFLGWMIFSIVLGMATSGLELGPILFTLFATIFFSVFMLTIGRWALHKILPFINKYFSIPGGILAFALSVCFLGAAFTEYIGIHAVFGAFIVGVALGDSVHMSSKTKKIIEDFVSNIFAPLFFISIGLKANFLTNFNFPLVLVILLLAFIGKGLGSAIGAYIGKFSRKESLIVGVGMNARGSVDVIFATLALEYQIISVEVFVALVLMALTTSMTSGYLLKMFMNNWLPRKRENSQNGHSGHGIIIFGVNELSLFIAYYLQKQKVKILMLDPEKKNLERLKHTEIKNYHINLDSPVILNKFDLSAYDTLCALGKNDKQNLRVTEIFEGEFDNDKIFRLISKKEAHSASLALPKSLLFRGYWYYDYLCRQLDKQPPIRQIRLDSEDTLNNFIFLNKKRIVPLLVHKPNGIVIPVSSYRQDVEEGDILVYVDIDKELTKQQNKVERIEIN